MTNVFYIKDFLQKKGKVLDKPTRMCQYCGAMDSVLKDRLGTFCCACGAEEEYNFNK